MKRCEIAQSTFLSVSANQIVAVIDKEVAGKQGI